MTQRFLSSAVSGHVTGLAALEAVSLSRASAALSRGLAVGAVSSQVAQLAASEAVSTSAGRTSTLDLGVSAVSSQVAGFTASVAIVASRTLASSLSTEARTALGAVSGEMIGLTAVEAVSTLLTRSSWDSLSFLRAITGHVSLSTAGEAAVVEAHHFK